VELGACHLPHGLVERLRAAVVEIGRRRRHVAQAGHTQDVRLGRAERMEDATPLEKVAADIHALMAGDAAERLEQLIALLLFGREGLPVSAEPTIEAACRRE